LINSALEGYDMPKLYLRKGNAGERLEMIDGNQRLETLRKFWYNDLPCDDQIQELSGKRYREMDREWQEKFDNFALDVVLVDGTESEARRLFAKHGEQASLNSQEKRNAMEGPVRDLVARLGKHRIHELASYNCLRMNNDLTAAHVLLCLLRGVEIGQAPKTVDRMYRAAWKPEALAKADKDIERAFDYLWRGFSPGGRCKFLGRVTLMYLTVAVINREYERKLSPAMFHDVFSEFIADRIRIGSPAGEYLRLNNAGHTSTEKRYNILCDYIEQQIDKYPRVVCLQ
jgi:hypothetical protein